MKRSLWKLLRAVARHIPGFRSPTQASMALAITYYAACIAIGFVSWPWGVAGFALPFFVFSMVDMSHAGNPRAARLTACVAGFAVLAGVALGLGSQGYRLKMIPAHPVPAQASGTTVVLTPRPTAAEPATPATNKTPQPSTTADPTAIVYVASKSGKTFHLPSCPSAKNIKPENRVEYKTRDEAIAAGLSPCKKCKP